MFDVMLEYSSGPWGLGLEWLQNKSTTGAMSEAGQLLENSNTGTQIAISSIYHF
jgi:hypothetical protein